MEDHGAFEGMQHYHDTDALRDVTSNDKYAITLHDKQVFTRELTAHGSSDWKLIHTSRGKTGNLNFAISNVQLARLAVVDETRVFVYDLDNERLESIATGNGRALICTAWSQHDADVLAAGGIDGLAYVWNLRSLSVPKFTTAVSPPLQHIAFSEAQRGLLAITTRRDLFIWLRDVPRDPVQLSINQSSATEIFVWHPFVPHRALTYCQDGSVNTWDFSEAISTAETTRHADRDSDDGIFGPPDGVKDRLSPTWRLFFSLKARQVEWMGEYGVLILSKNGHELSLYDAREAMSSASSIWELQLSYRILSFRFADENEGALLALAETGKMEKLMFPIHTLEAISWSEFVKSRASSLHNSPSELSQNGDTVATTEVQANRETFRPVSIASMRRSYGRSLLRLNDPRSPAIVKKKGDAVKHTDRRSSESLQKLSMLTRQPILTPSKDSQRAQEETPTAMPFLSPGIPARDPSPAAVSITESLVLPTSRRESTETLASAATASASADHASDSDDETFAGNLQGSDTLMPGAYLVPLPKSCGALFAENGQLLCFFPPRVRTAAPEQPPAQEGTFAQNEKPRKELHIFPRFGNLLSDFSAQKDQNDADDSSSMEASLVGVLPTFVLKPSSFPGPTLSGSRKKSIPLMDTKNAKAILSVRDLDDISLSSRKLAQQLRALCQDGESGAEVCTHNERVTRAAGLEDTTKIWQLLALVLDNKVPLQFLRQATSTLDVQATVDEAFSWVQNAYNIDIADDERSRDHTGKLYWGDHTAGRWLVEKLLKQCEKLGDLQTLALASVVVSEAAQPPAVLKDHTSTQIKLPMSGIDYIGGDTPPAPRIRNSSVSAIDALRSYSNKESPMKHHHLSQPSSQNASMPTTPFLDSTSSTPPFTLPFSRQGSRLSASGSASPEHHRGSFSAAARYYAQSITDRFASYGTSPTSKKLSVSPGNELSSSLPTANGSWSKTVSFASTTDTMKDSRRSADYTDRDEASDSDRTIDDASLPTTPKSIGGDVVVRTKNQGYFDDDVSGSCKASLLSPELIVKGHFWRMQYAELLRSWGLDVQAAEIEKVSGLVVPGLSMDKQLHDYGPSVSKATSVALCSICQCTVAGIEQACPQCLHISHLSCLRDYIEGSNQDDKFLCPSGCGCACAAMT